MADAPASGAGVRKGVGVQVPPRAQLSGLTTVAIAASFALIFPSLRKIDIYEELTSTEPSSCDLSQTGRVTTDEKHISSSVPSAHRT